MLNVVVVGNGMVGHHYVEQLVSSNIEANITVIGGEPRPAYDRVHLSEYFAGRSPEDLALTTREHYQEIGVAAHFGDPVVAICLLYTSPSPRDYAASRMPSSA